MSGGGGGEVVVVGCQVPSLPPPRPRSPPPYPDLYGKRRELAKLQMLEREKGFLEQEELKFVESLQPASRCCKEVADFVAAKSDPLILTKKQISRSCGLWRWLCGSWSCCFSWFCCCNGCSCHLKRPTCRSCSPCDCNLCSSCSCSFPKLQCCSCPPCPCCCTMTSCPKSSCSCCKFKLPSCLRSSCCECVCSCPKPQDLYPCFRCRKNCCDPTCCICY